MYFRALGGAGEIGASCYLLEIDGKYILIDAGIRLNPSWGQSPFPALELIRKLDLVIVTHAHLDHTGALPLVIEQFPEVPVIATKPTFRLTKLLLGDTVELQKNQPLILGNEDFSYNRFDLERLFQNMLLASYEQWFKPFPDRQMRICFRQAGHILGASSILIIAEETKVLITGDFSISDQQTVRGVQDFSFQPDLLIMEGTYANEVHPSRKEELKNFALAIKRVLERKGIVLLPCFAVGRAQEIILILQHYQNLGTLPRCPIYVDGLVLRVCDLYAKVIGKSFFRSRNVHRVNPKERRDLGQQGPACIVASSGTLRGGPSLGYARSIVKQPSSVIFFSGYLDEESPGRGLLNLKKGGEIELDGEAMAVQCRVERYQFSAHADALQLRYLVDSANPKAVILVHGRDHNLQAFAHSFNDRLIWTPSNQTLFDPCVGLLRREVK